MSWPASEESGKPVEVELVSGPVVEPVVGLAESFAKRASPLAPSDSATLRSSSPYYTGSHSCTSAATAFAGP